MLHDLVQAKTGPIKPELWKEALQETKKDVQAHPVDFRKKTKAEKLEYISNVMSVYIIMCKLHIRG
jgi:hypothetical protein